MSQVNIQSSESLPIHGMQTLVLESRATNVRNSYIDTLCEEFREYTLPICKEVSETPLLSLRAINHTIPLISMDRVYVWHPARCPEQLKPLWRVKCDDYLKTGQ